MGRILRTTYSACALITMCSSTMAVSESVRTFRWSAQMDGLRSIHGIELTKVIYSTVASTILTNP